MLTPEEIQQANKSKVNAIFERFNPVQPESDNQDLAKSEESDLFWTKDSLDKFKEDLFKGIDDGTIGQKEVESAREQLGSLQKSVREVDGKETEVFVKG